MAEPRKPNPKPAEKKQETPPPKVRQLLPNAVRDFEHGPVHVQIVRETRMDSNHKVHVTWPDGRVWIVRVRASGSPPPSSPKNKREENHPLPKTVVFLKDAKEEPDRPLDLKEKEDFKVILEKAQRVMHWAELHHVESEQRIQNLGPGPEKPERRKRQAAKTPKENKRTILDSVPEIQYLLSMESQHREPEEVENITGKIATSRWFTDFAHEKLKRAGFQVTDEHTRHLRFFGQTHFVEVLNKAIALRTFKNQAEQIREKAVQAALAALKARTE